MAQDIKQRCWGLSLRLSGLILHPRDTENDSCLLSKRKSSELGMDSPLSNDSGLTMYRQKLQLSSNVHS